MYMLTAGTQPQPDYLAIAMVAALLVFVVVAALRKRFSASGAKEVVEVAPAPVPQEPQPTPSAPGSAGQLKLHDVQPKTAAMLMAIVADKIGKPLNELRFVSIREVK